DAVDEQARAEPVHDEVDEVDRACRGPARGDDQIGGARADGLVKEVGVVVQTAHSRLGTGTERLQPGDEQWAERVAYPAVAGRPVVEQFVSEDEDIDARAR